MTNKLLYKRSIGIYKKFIILLTPFQIKTFKDICNYLETNNKGYTFKLNYGKIKNKKTFHVFLTNSQIENVNKAIQNDEIFNLYITPKQLKKTCSTIISLNKELKNIKDKVKIYRVMPVDKKEKLMLLEKENAKKAKKLKKLKLQYQLINANPKPTPKGKKYKVLQNEDLIPTTTNPSTNGVNILKNILKYPETKRLLGISLTSDLKEKNKKFRL